MFRDESDAKFPVEVNCQNCLDNQGMVRFFQRSGGSQTSESDSTQQIPNFAEFLHLHRHLHFHLYELKPIT